MNLWLLLWLACGLLWLFLWLVAFFVAGSWPICGFPVANLWLSRHSGIASSHHLILGIFYPFLVQTCTVLSLRRKNQQKPAHKPAAGRRIPGFRAARSMSDADPLFAMPSLGSYSARHPSDVKVFATTNRGGVGTGVTTYASVEAHVNVNHEQHLQTSYGLPLPPAPHVLPTLPQAMHGGQHQYMPQAAVFGDAPRSAAYSDAGHIGAPPAGYHQSMAVAGGRVPQAHLQGAQQWQQFAQCPHPYPSPGHGQRLSGGAVRSYGASWPQVLLSENRKSVPTPSALHPLITLVLLAHRHRQCRMRSQ